MGSIRPSNIKRIAQEIVEESPDEFSKDFHANREILKTKADFTSKKTLNSVAGYVTRYILKKESRKKKEMEEYGTVTTEVT